MLLGYFLSYKLPMLKCQVKLENEIAIISGIKAADLLLVGDINVEILAFLLDVLINGTA